MQQDDLVGTERLYANGRLDVKFPLDGAQKQSPYQRSRRYYLDVQTSMLDGESSRARLSLVGLAMVVACRDMLFWQASPSPKSSPLKGDDLKAFSLEGRRLDEGEPSKRTMATY